MKLLRRQSHSEKPEQTPVRFGPKSARAGFAVPSERSALHPEIPDTRSELWSDEKLFAAVDALLADRAESAEEADLSAFEKPDAARQPEAESPAEAPASLCPDENSSDPEPASPIPEEPPIPPTAAAEAVRADTGSLPSLEELFGPAEPEQPSDAPESSEEGKAQLPTELPQETSRPEPTAVSELRTRLSGWLSRALQLDPADNEEGPEELPQPPVVIPPELLAHREPDPPAQTPAAPPEPSEADSPDVPEQDQAAEDKTPPEGEPDFLSILVAMERDLEETEAPEAPAAPSSSVPDAAPVPSEASPAETPEKAPSADSGQPAAPQTQEQPQAAAPEQPSGEKHRRWPWSRRDNSLAPMGMTVEDFLEAAVPIEDVGESRSSGKRRRKKPYLEGLSEQTPFRAEPPSQKPEPAGAAPSKPERNDSPEPDTVVSASARPAQTPRHPSVSGPEPQQTHKPAARQTPRPASKHTAKQTPKQAPKPEPAPEAAPESPVQTPEAIGRRYEALLRKQGLRLIATGLFTILSLFLTLYLSLEWTFLPEIFSGGTTAYLLLLLLAAMLAANLEDFKLAFLDLRRKQFSPLLLIALASLFCAVDAVYAAGEARAPYTVAVGVLLLISLWGRYDYGTAIIAILKVLREKPLAAGVSEVQSPAKGPSGLTRTEPDEDTFLEKLETRSLCDKVLSVYTLIALLSGLGITLLIAFGLKQNLAWAGTLVFLGSVPVTGLLASPRILLLLSQRLSASQAALCGYYGAEAFGGEHAILIGDDDIFPPGSLSLNGYKVYNGSVDQIIAYAAAATRSSDSALGPVFDDLLTNQNGRHYTVDSFRFYDSGGIGATILDDVVLLGSLEFMRRMGVHMDPGTKVRQAVYISINGELAAVFAVRYAPSDNIRRGLASIAGNRHFKGILVTRTFLGTPSFLRAKFGVPNGAFEYPPTKERLRLSETEFKRSGAQGAILAKDSFTGFAQAAGAGRMLRSASLLTAVLAVLGGILGLLFMGILAALPARETATAVNVLIYVLAWLIPTLLLTGWGKHF